MKVKVAAEAARLLEEGLMAGFLALKDYGGHVGPYLFTRADELEHLSLGDGEKPGDLRYPLVKQFSRLAKARPHEVFGLLVRGCDERAIERIMALSRSCALHPKKMVLIGISCPPELAEACQCPKPWPDALVAGEQTPGAELPELAADPFQALEDWFAHSDRCLKCFGCRNVCPVCDCRECTMEIEALVPQRELPPHNTFLLTRAVHMADRCSYCGLCEEACPAHIPLKDLYRFVAKALGLGLALPGAPAPIRPVDLFRRPRAI